MTAKPRSFKSGTVVMIALVAVIAGLLAAAHFRLKAHRKDVRSIAVLPFLNGTDSQEVDRLCKGLTREIIRNLNNSHALSVTPAEQVMTYKGNVLSPWKIGNTLGVDVVVVGRVQLDHERLIIQTDLMNVSDESQLWGHQYELEHPNFDAVTAETGNDIADRVLATLSRKE